MLAPEDRFSRTRVKCEDYLRTGVPEVWAIDPEQRKAHVPMPDGVMREHRGGPRQLGETGISVDLNEIFRALDRRVRAGSLVIACAGCVLKQDRSGIRVARLWELAGSYPGVR